MKKKKMILMFVSFIVIVIICCVWWLFMSGYFYRLKVSKIWYTTYDNLTYCFTLNKNGTGESKYYNSDNITNFTYEIARDSLTIIEANGERDTYSYQIDDQILKIFDIKFYDDYQNSVTNQKYVRMDRLNEEYDIENFKKITQKELIEKLENKEEFHLLVSRETCSYCRIFRVDALKSVEDYNYELYYLDSSSINDYKLLHEYDENFDGDYIPTPTVFYIKNGKVINKNIGAVFYLEYLHFLRQNGVKQRVKVFE